MKTNLGFWRRLSLILLAVVLLAGIYALTLVLSSTSASRAVEQTRRSLRAQGFKTDLSDFDFTVPSEQRGFDLSMNWMQAVRMRQNPFVPLNLMVTAGSNSAIIVWKEELVRAGSDQVAWPEFETSCETEESNFAAARDEALARPIRFNLDASRGMAMLLPQLGVLRRMSVAFSSGAIADLHEQDRDAAWTNLLATTRLVTAWQPEPAEISHIVRFALVAAAFDTTWQALQAGDWTDARLAALQQEWESVDFFKNLPETAAFTRASAADVCERGRREPFPMTLGEISRQIMQSPRYAPGLLKNYWNEVRYRNEGTYDDEKALLLFYRDREVEIREAVRAPSWQAMRSMSGVTNQALFVSKYHSRTQSLLNMRAVGANIARQGYGFLARAAEAETRRRLILAAIALERFRIRHGNYPATLAELVPEFLKNPPVDFMDGRPLRYRLGNDGRFVLYSTGLDCVDDGGQMPQRASEDFMGIRPIGRPGSMQGAMDLVWPRPANTNEIAELHEQELEQRQEQMARMTELESAEYWARTARRQASVEKILASPPAPAREMSYNGRPLSEILRNKEAPGTNTPALADLLALHQVTTGDEPEKVTFEAPISYDALTNIGSLQLYIDPIRDEDSDEGPAAGQVECSRATNGDCLLAWNTIFETPGKHALVMGIELNDPRKAKEEIVGPAAAVVVSNLCQFSISSATFDSATGASFRARLPEMKADYTIDILSVKGERVKTISGSTSDGTINVFWDLIGDNGRKLGDESFNTVFHLTLPESGRSQTLKGP